MRAAVIAAAGNLGGRVLKECLDRGWQVTAFVNNAPCRDERAQQVRKSLFDLTKEDIAGFDVVFSAFGSGFKANPTINRQALNALAALTAGTSRRFLAIVGSGCLYTDEKKEIRAYETAEYPPFLKEISMNTALGVQDVAVMEDVQRAAFDDLPITIRDGDGVAGGNNDKEV